MKTIKNADWASKGLSGRGPTCKMVACLDSFLHKWVAK